MTKAKIFAPGVVAPFKAPQKKTPEPRPQLVPDPARVEAELAITALAKGGFAERDKAAQIPAGPQALARLQQLAGNEFVTQVLTGPGAPIPESKIAKSEAPAPVKEPKGPPKAPEPAADVAKAAKPEAGPGALPKGAKPAEGTKPQSAPGAPEEKTKDGVPIQAKKEGAASLPLPPVQHARDTAKAAAAPPSMAAPAAAPAPADGGGAAVTVAAWKGKVHKAVGAMPPKKVAEGKGAPLKDAGAKAASKTDQDAGKLPEDGSKAITPPKQPPGTPAIPEDVSKAALKLVDDKTGRKLDEVTLPPLVKSPQDNQPEIGKEPPKVVPVGAQTAAQADQPPKALAAAQKTEKKEEPPAAKAPEQKKTPLPPATVKDEPPPVIDLPANQKVDIGGVVAQLIADEGKHAKRIVDDARNAAYNGALKKAWPEMGADFDKTEVVVVDSELRNLAAAAGVGKEALDQKVADRRKELAESKKEVEADLSASNEAARKTQAGARSRYLTAVNDARDALEKSAQERMGQVKSGVDPQKVRKERDELVAQVDRKAGTWSVNYEDAAKKFKDSLDAEAEKQIRAYKVAAQEDEKKLNDQAEKNAGDDKDKREKDAAEARRKYRQTKYWLDEQSAAVRLFVEKAKVRTDDKSATFKSELNEAARHARDQIRDWAAQRLGQERTFWQKFLDWMADWLNQANVEAEAWAAKRAADSKQAAEKDNQFLDTELAKLQQLSKKEAEDEVAKLDDEQFAIIKAYFDSGGDRVAAVAAGVIAHISAVRRPELAKQFEAEVLKSTDLEKVTAVGKAQTSTFDPVIRSDGLRKAFAGPGTKEEDVFANLSGMTAVQAHAVELQYEADWKEPLRKRLDEELNDWATWSDHDIKRATALLSGDPATAAAIELNQAMHGNWNGLDLGGTDEETIFKALRNKSPAEIAAIKKAYLETYGKPLDADLKSELKDGIGGSHDYDRAQALLESDTIKADAVAADKAMHGGWLGLGVGTDRKGIEDIYTQMDSELEAEADAKGWDSAKLKLEKSKRRKALDSKYGNLYENQLKDLKKREDQSLLQAAYEDEMSGAELRLIQGLHDQDDIKANAAKIRIEHDGIVYSDDKVMTGAVQAAYKTEYKDRKRDLNLDIDEKLEAARKEAYLQGNPNSFYKDYPPEKIREMRRAAASTAAADARNASADNFDKLENEYNTQYKNKFDSIFGNPSAGLREDLKEDTQGAANDKAQKLIDNKGYLTDVQEVRYAIQGLGTGDEAKEIIKGKSKDEIKTLKKEWDDDPEIKKAKLGNLQDYVLDDYSGREYEEMADALMFGEPETPQEKLAKAKRDLAFEWKSSNRLATDELFVLKKRVDALETQVNAFEAFESLKGRPDFDWKQYSEMQGEVDSKVAQVDSAISVHRNEVDVISDTATQVIGAVVTAIIVAVSIIADVFTAGGAAAATPAEGAAISGVWALLGISLAGTALTMLTKAVLKGDAYGWEDAGEDLAIGIVDALMSLPTGGMGGKLLKEGGMLAKLAEKKLFGKLVANFLAHAAEGALQSLPGAVLGNALNKENYKGGNAILNVLEGAAVQSLGAAAMSGGVGVLHVAVQTDLVRIRTNPEYQAKIYEKFRAKNPGATREEFLSHLDNLIISRTEKGFKDPRLQEDLHGRLTEHLPPEQKALFKDVPIEVLPEDQFKMLTGSSSGKAVTIIRDGRPLVVMRTGAQSLELSAEGFHLLQSKEPVNAPKVAKLDESNLKNWSKLDIDTQFDLYNTKLDLEIDANQRALTALEEHQKVAKNPAEVASEIEKTKTNLENLKKRQAEVAGVSPQEKLEFTNKAKPKPAYLDDPPRLFTKDPTLPKPVEKATLPSRPIENARREYDALKTAESKGPLSHDQFLRLQIVENELKAHYVILEGESPTQVEKRLFDQRPRESLADYRKRLESMRAEVERAGNTDVWVQYQQLVENVGAEIEQVASLRQELDQAKAEFRKADEAWLRQRRAMRDPRIKLDPEQPTVLRSDVDKLSDAVRKIEGQIKSLETRGGARSQAYEFGDLGLVDPCFVPGTPVLTPLGLKDIDALEPGDVVTAYDWRTGEAVDRRVVATSRSATECLIRLRAGGSEILATRGHPFWLEHQRTWRRADGLSSGDVVRTVSGESALDEVAPEPRISPTVNLIVEGCHNYFVGRDSILVHNGTPRPDFNDLTKRSVFIYRVERFDPATGNWVPIYIGKTRETVQRRFAKHLADKPEWSKMHDQKTAGGEPMLRSVQETSGQWTEFETAVWENHKIKEYRAKGFELENEATPVNKDTFDRLKRFFQGC
jgi:hypothetical protein